MDTWPEAPEPWLPLYQGHHSPEPCEAPSSAMRRPGRYAPGRGGEAEERTLWATSRAGSLPSELWELPKGTSWGRNITPRDRFPGVFRQGGEGSR